MKKEYYTIPELSQIYNLGYRTIWNYIQDNDLKAIKIKDEIRVSKKEFAKLIKHC